MFEFFCWNAWMATSLKVFWKVEPEPFSVVEPLLLPLLLLLLELPHAASARVRATSATSARATREGCNGAGTRWPLSDVVIGVQRRNGGEGHRGQNLNKKGTTP